MSSSTPSSQLWNADISHVSTLEPSTQNFPSVEAFSSSPQSSSVPINVTSSSALRSVSCNQSVSVTSAWTAIPFTTATPSLSLISFGKPSTSTSYFSESRSFNSTTVPPLSLITSTRSSSSIAGSAAKSMVPPVNASTNTGNMTFNVSFRDWSRCISLSLISRI